jgi:hypothetical protein
MDTSTELDLRRQVAGLREVCLMLALEIVRLRAQANRTSAEAELAAISTAWEGMTVAELDATAGADVSEAEKEMRSQALNEVLRFADSLENLARA